MLSQVSTVSYIFVLQFALVSAVHGPGDAVPEDHWTSEDTLQRREEAAGPKKSATKDEMKAKAKADYAQALREKQLQMQSALKEKRAQATQQAAIQQTSTTEAPTTTTQPALEAGFHNKSHKVIDSNNEVQASSAFNVNQAEKASVAANKAADMLSHATTRFEGANKVYQETQKKLEELRALLEIKKAELQAKLAANKTKVDTNADRDELDQLNDMVENLMEHADKNKEKMDEAKKMVAEQMVRADAFFTAADKQMNALRKFSMKEVSGRDREWLNAEQGRLMKARDKIKKLQDAAGVHSESLNHAMLNLSETPVEELTNLAPGVIDEIEKSLASTTADLEKTLEDAETTENKLVKTEERQQQIRDKLAQMKRDDKAGNNLGSLDTRSTKEIAAEKAKSEIDHKKQELEEKKNLLAQKKKEKELEKDEERRKELEKQINEGTDAFHLQALENEKKAEEEEKKAIVRKIAQKKRVKANIERAIAIEIEVQRKRVEHNHLVKATTHRLKVQLGKIKDPSVKPAWKKMDLPPSMHFDEDFEPDPSQVAESTMPAEDDKAVKIRMKEIEEDPLLDHEFTQSPKGRMLLEGSPDRLKAMTKEF